MKNTYVKPSVVTYGVDVETLLIAVSIQSIEGENQTPIKKNDDEDFEAGAKPHYNPWNAWE